MRNFGRSDGGNRSGKKFGKRDFGKKSFGRDEGRPMMHQAVCGDCGDVCEVPFKPSGDRPVFCKDCFKKGGSGNFKSERDYSDRGGRGDFEDRSFGRGDAGRPGMHRAVCDECGDSCEVPFKPSGDKPIFCKRCFKKGGNPNAGGNKSNEQFKIQFEMLNDKLDRVLKALNLLVPKEAANREAAPKEKELAKVPPMEEMKAVVKEAKVVKPKRASKKSKK